MKETNNRALWNTAMNVTKQRDKLIDHDTLAPAEQKCF